VKVIIIEKFSETRNSDMFYERNESIGVYTIIVVVVKMWLRQLVRPNSSPCW